MLEQVDVYYDGWGEHWRWGTLVSTTAITGRPLIAFEFSDEAKNRGLELSSFRLPLAGASYAGISHPINGATWACLRLVARRLGHVADGSFV